MTETGMGTTREFRRGSARRTSVEDSKTDGHEDEDVELDLSPAQGERKHATRRGRGKTRRMGRAEMPNLKSTFSTNNSRSRINCAALRFAFFLRVSGLRISAAAMSDVPSLSSGNVGSRFVSQEDIDVARARRDEQWKAAYARFRPTSPTPTLAVLMIPHKDSARSPRRSRRKTSMMAGP